MITRTGKTLTTYKKKTPFEKKRDELLKLFEKDEQLKQKRIKREQDILRKKREEYIKNKNRFITSFNKDETNRQKRLLFEKNVQFVLFKNLYETRKNKVSEILKNINSRNTLNRLTLNERNLINQNIISSRPSVFTANENNILNTNFNLFVIDKSNELVESYLFKEFNGILVNLFDFFVQNRNANIPQTGLNAIKIISSIDITDFFTTDIKKQNSNILKYRSEYIINYIDINQYQEIVLPLEYITVENINYNTSGISIQSKYTSVDINKSKYHALLFIKNTPQNNGITSMEINVLLPQYFVETYNFQDSINRFVNLIFNASNIRYSLSYINNQNDIIPSPFAFTNIEEEYTLKQDRFSSIWCLLYFNVYLFIRYKLGGDFDFSISKGIIREINSVKKDLSLKLSTIKSYIYYLKNIKYTYKGKDRKLLDHNLYYFNYFYANNRLCTIKNIIYDSSENIILSLKIFKEFQIVDSKTQSVYFNNLYNNIIISDPNLKVLLLNSIKPEYIVENKLSIADDIVKILYFKLLSDKVYDDLNPDVIFNDYYINKEILRNFNSTVDTKKDFYNKLYLKDYLEIYDPVKYKNANLSSVNDTDIDLGINLRNNDYINTTQTFGKSCAIPPILTPYQKSALDIMIQKISNPRVGESKGLLLWYGTGSGKTYTASIISKMVGFCLNYRYLKNIIIISPISAFINFRKELQDQRRQIGIFLNKFPLIEDDPSKNFYFVGDDNSRIFLFTHTSFEKVIKNPETNLVSSFNIKFNTAFLSESLLIIDECHNFVSPNVAYSISKKTNQLMLDCCNKARNVLLLTATPMQNSIYEIEQILAMADGRNTSVDNLNFLRSNFDYTQSTMNGTVINENNIVTFARSNRIWDLPTTYNSTLLTTTRYPQNVRNTIFNNMFENRIIEYSDTSGLPPYIERIYFVNLETAKEDELISVLKREQLASRTNKQARQLNSFGTIENDFIFNTDIKKAAIVDLINRREQTNKNNKLEFRTNLPLYDFKNMPLKFKYIIFCTQTKNIRIIYEMLLNLFGITHSTNTLIGIIDGSVEADQRRKLVDEYEKGTIKIMIISKAGEEGVDFKRTALIILSDFVYTPSEYQQILGRAVRLGSNNPDPRPGYDSSTSIPGTIECYSIINTFMGNHTQIKAGSNRPSIMYSYEVSSLNIVLTKRAEINTFKDSISRIFYNNATGVSPTRRGPVISPSTKRRLKKSVKRKLSVKRKSVKKKLSLKRKK